jgi:hypothetical protein
MKIRTGLFPILLLSGCATMGTQTPGGTFGDDVKFLKKHTDVLVLQSPDGRAQVAVVPSMQGRVMTSSADGPGGSSAGWINYDLIASGKTQDHINAYGGEDRFWMGPEGGQFSIFFRKGVPFDFKNWFTPACIDTEPFGLVNQAADRAHFRRRVKLTNYSDFTFDIEINREVRLLSAADLWKNLGLPAAAGIKSVAFETENRLTNCGSAPWKKETGLLSIWILGMLKPSPATTVVIPFVPGPEAQIGPVVNDAYFGKVPADRLVVKDKVLFFSGDGKHRSKIGIPPRRCRPVAGSYDAANQILTLVQFNPPAGPADYVNSMWELQKDPFAGDVVNSYNDGPVTPGGAQLGPFYELETSSPAAALAPNGTITHLHRTIHLQGPEAALDPVARAVLGVGLEEIKTALKR